MGPQQLSQLLQHQLHITPQLQLHTMPQLLIMPQLQSNTNLPHTLSNTELLMTTPRPTSMPKKPLTERQPPDLTEYTFPMAVYKLLPTLLITTMVSSLMSNTKVPQFTQKLSHTTQLQLLIMPQLQLIMLPQSSSSTLKKLLSSVHTL